MITRTFLLAAIGAATILASAPALTPRIAVAETKPKTDAAAGFDRLSEALQTGDDKALETLAPKALLPTNSRDPEAVKSWHSELADTLRDAKSTRTRAEGTDAVVRLTSSDGKSDYELVLRLDGKQWVLAAARPYLVRGPFLKDANGSRPQTIKLTARTTNAAYGTSAFSFAHVTQKVSECKNRMDLWFCHNQDFHGCGQTRFTTVKAKNLGKVTGIPVGATWSDTIAANSGAVYVAHCKYEGHRDFYVAFKVKRAGSKAAQLQWTVLAAGLGTPARIDAPQPLRSNDGVDAWDGLCGK